MPEESLGFTNAITFIQIMSQYIQDGIDFPRNEKIDQVKDLLDQNIIETSESPVIILQFGLSQKGPIRTATNDGLNFHLLNEKTTGDIHFSI